MNQSRSQRKDRPNTVLSTMESMYVELEFIENILGSLPGDKEIYRQYIASKAPDASTIEDEIASIGTEGVYDKGKTVFPKMEDGTPFAYAYQIKGVFKGSRDMLSRSSEKDPETGKKMPSSESAKLTAAQKVIAGNIFVFPQKIPFILPEGAVIGECQRPLRISGPQGERVALTSSEEIPAGTIIRFEIKYMRPSLKKLLIEWLDYGLFMGFGQWRNAGFGRFKWWEISKEEYEALCPDQVFVG